VGAFGLLAIASISLNVLDGYIKSRFDLGNIVKKQAPAVDLSIF
jgi:hypothetical protein